MKSQIMKLKKQTITLNEQNIKVTELCSQKKQEAQIKFDKTLSASQV